MTPPLIVFSKKYFPTHFPVLLYLSKFLTTLFQGPYITWRDCYRCEQNSSDCRAAGCPDWGRSQNPYTPAAPTFSQLLQCMLGPEQLFWDHLGLLQQGDCWHYLDSKNKHCGRWRGAICPGWGLLKTWETLSLSSFLICNCLQMIIWKNMYVVWSQGVSNKCQKGTIYVNF